METLNRCAKDCINLILPETTIAISCSNSERLSDMAIEKNPYAPTIPDTLPLATTDLHLQPWLPPPNVDNGATFLARRNAVMNTVCKRTDLNNFLPTPTHDTSFLVLP